MTGKKINEAIPKTALEDSDMLPVAAADDGETYHLSGAALFASLPAAAAGRRGVVELATQEETLLAADAERAVTPASLRSAVGAAHLAPGWCYAGQVAPPLTASRLLAAFQARFGRPAANGDLATFADTDQALYLLSWSAAAGAWWGANLSSGRFVQIA